MTLAELIDSAIRIRDEHPQLATEAIAVWIRKSGAVVSPSLLSVRSADDIENGVTTTEVILSC